MGGAEDSEVTLSYFLLVERESIDWLTLLLHLTGARKGKKQPKKIKNQTCSGSKCSEAQNRGEPSRRQPIREQQRRSGTSNQEETR